MTIPTVSNGDDILTSWGNAVADALNHLERVCVVTKTNDVIATGVYTPMTWATQLTDPDNWWTSGSRITPHVAGWYLVTFHVEVVNLGAANRVAAAIQVNGSQVVRDDRGADIITPDLSISTVLHVDGTEYIEGSVYHDYGSIRNAAGRMTVHMVRPD